MNEHDAHQHHVLAMIEAAQRAGRSEDEIVAIVERYFGEAPPAERGLVRRLIRWTLPRAA